MAVRKLHNMSTQHWPAQSCNPTDLSEDKFRACMHAYHTKRHGCCYPASSVAAAVLADMLQVC